MIDPIQPLSMMGSGIEPATGAIGAAGAAATPPSEATPPAAGGFGDLLTSSLDALNDQMLKAEHMSELAATGALPDPTVALVEVEKADLAFQMAVQVRNRLVEGWQDLTRMGF